MLHKHFQRLLTVVTSAGLVLGSMGDAWAAKAPNPADSYTTQTPNNWGLGRIGNGSTDVKASSLLGMFDSVKKAPKLILDPETGLVTP